MMGVSGTKGRALGPDLEKPPRTAGEREAGADWGGRGIESGMSDMALGVRRSRIVSRRGSTFMAADMMKGGREGACGRLAPPAGRGSASRPGERESEDEAMGRAKMRREAGEGKRSRYGLGLSTSIACAPRVVGSSTRAGSNWLSGVRRRLAAGAGSGSRWHGAERAHSPATRATDWDGGRRDLRQAEAAASVDGEPGSGRVCSVCAVTPSASAILIPGPRPRGPPITLPK